MISELNAFVHVEEAVLLHAAVGEAHTAAHSSRGCALSFAMTI